MELVGIALSIPVAFSISAIYSFFLARAVLKRRPLVHTLRAASYLVLTLFGIEIVLLAVLGAVRTNTLIGRGFYTVHLLIFFLGPPALANLLVLRERAGILAKWYVAASVCTVLAFVLVMVQYGVSEPLYGIE